MTELPADVELVRTTGEFDAASVPAGLLRTHRVVSGVWGRLRVTAGALTLVFEDGGADRVVLAAGESVVIPPDRPHRVEPSPDVRFHVEFHR